MKRLLVMILSVLWMGSVFAEMPEETKKEKEDNRFPLGCRDRGYTHDLMVMQLQPDPLGGEQQTMYFLFNQTGTSVSLYQMRDSDSMYSIFMNTTINPKQWAVLATSEPQTRFICTVPDSKSTYGKIVDCSQMLKVCEYNNVIYGLNNRGNFWIVRNNSRNGAVRDVVRYGIIPAS